MVVPEKQSSVEEVAESELNKNNPPRVSWSWNEEDIDAPTSEFETYLHYIFWNHEFGNIAYMYVFWIHVYARKFVVI